MNVDNKQNQCVTIYYKQIVINYNKYFLFNVQISKKNWSNINKNMNVKINMGMNINICLNINNKSNKT